ncbi:MAG: hypothetical protein FWG50_06100 [Kiritimatiellaeota bacterium]|nr:hypothetical protein [Kiritimatiellota bacterium]
MMTGIGIMGMALTGYAQKIDILKPVYQRQEKELAGIMERLAAEGLEYEVVREKIADTNKKGDIYFTSVNTVRIPEDLKAKITRYDQRFMRGHFDMYLDDPKYSFYAAVLILGRGMGTDLPKSVVSHDKELWWKSAQRAEPL